MTFLREFLVHNHAYNGKDPLAAPPVDHGGDGPPIIGQTCPAMVDIRRFKIRQIRRQIRADIRHGWWIHQSYSASKAANQHAGTSVRWLLCVPFYKIITMRAASHSKRQRRNKTTLPSSTENKLTESEREVDETNTSEHNV